MTMGGKAGSARRLPGKENIESTKKARKMYTPSTVRLIVSSVLSLPEFILCIVSSSL